MKFVFLKKLLTARHLLFALLAVAFFLVCLFAFVPNNDNVTLINEHSRSWNDGWSYKGQSVSLPFFTEVSGRESVTISKTIDPVFENSGMSISIMTSMQSLLIQVDGTVIYQFNQGSNAYMALQPPPAWHIVRLAPEMIGQELSITYASPLDNYAGSINGIEVGSKFSTVFSFLGSRIGSILLCMVLLISGVACILIALFFQKSIPDFQRLLYLGIFTSLIALWSACESRVLQIFIENVQGLMVLSYVCIMLAPVPLLLFFRERFSAGIIRVIYNIKLGAFSLFFFLSIFLQALGLLPFHSFFIAFLALTLLGILFITVTQFICYFQEKTGESKLYLLSTIVMLVFSSADFLRFTVGSLANTGLGDTTFFTRLGLLLFLLLMGYLTIHATTGYYKSSVLTSTYKTLAHTDNLTGLYNRSYMYDVCNKVFVNAMRDGKPFSFVMLDIDNFKKYNDYYGHLAGDAVLKQVSAQVLQTAVLRSLDAVIRYGGEEFLLLLPGCDQKGATHVAERVLSSISTLNIAHAYSEVAPHITASLGLYTAVPTREDTMERFIDCADKALYQAKAAGKNRFVVYHE